MASVFDPRIVQVTIYFEDGAQTFNGLSENGAPLSVYAFGTKILGTIYNECSLTIINLTKETRNQLLTRLTPWRLNRKDIKVTLDVGRESYGTFRLFSGEMYLCTQTQPPDIGITMTALTNVFYSGSILAQTESSIASLRTIAKKIADNNGCILDFHAKDKLIENFTYSGVASYQIRDLNEVGGIIASITNGVLTVLNAGQALPNPPIIVNAANGMVGIPSITDNGIIVKTMIANGFEVGRLIDIESEMLPAVNGRYQILKINFEIASRDQPFWYIIEAQVPAYNFGTMGS